MLSARDLPLLPVFASVVRHGSFTAAARELGLGKSVVSAHVRTLEERCGVRLLERTTRRVGVTQAGEQVHAVATAVLDGLRSTALTIEAQRLTPTGTLRVAAPHAIAGSVVAPVLARLARDHLSLRFDLVVGDEPRDLVADGIDVAVRLGRLADSPYIARRLAVDEEILVAAPDIAATIAPDAGPSALRHLPWAAHSALRSGPIWKFTDGEGRFDEVPVDPRVLASSGDDVQALVAAGFGVAVLPSLMVAADLAAGRIQRVCEGWYRRRIALFAVLPSRHAPPRVRVFLDALKARIDRSQESPAR